MKKLISLFFALFLSIIFTVSSDCSTYYLRADGSVTAANKANATSCSAAASAMNITQHNAATFTAGDTITLCDTGGVFRDAILKPPSAGTVNASITYNASGTPVINGTDIKANADFTLTVAQTYTYEAVYSLIANGEEMVWENGTKLTEKTSIATVEAAAGSFWISGGKVYVRATDSSNVSTNGIVYEVPGRTENIDTNNKDYLIIDGITCIRTSGTTAATVGGIKVASDYVIVRNLSATDHRRHALTFYTTAATYGQAYNLVLSAWNDPAVSFYQSSYCTLSNSSITRTSTTQEGVITFHGGAASNTVIGCTITGSETTQTYGINIYDLGTNGNLITKNLFTGSFYHVLHIGDTSTNGSTGNIISYNIINPTSVGHCVSFVQKAATGTIMYNNVFYNNHTSDATIRWYNGATGGVFKNNIIYPGSGGAYINVDAASSGGFISNNNIFFNGGANTFTWSGTAYNFAGWKTNSGQDANSINSDPLFVTNGSNFKLLATSPAINIGEDVGLRNDFNNRSVPKRGLVDIGAYEYGSNRMAIKINGRFR